MLNTGVAHAETDDGLKVLVLNSYHPGYDWSDRIMDAIQAEFDKTGLHIDLYIEYMDARRYSYDEAFSYSKELCSAKYHDVQFDVVICSDEAAFYFFLQDHDLVFPGAPMVFCGIQDFNDSMLQGKDSVTGVVEAYDYKSTVDVALELHPSISQIVLISERSSEDVRPYQEEFAAYAAQLNRQVELGHFSLAELTMAELHEKTAGLGDESVVLLQSALKDSSGEIFEIEQITETIQRHCSVPIYAVDSRWLGLGALGGKVIDGGYQGQAAALMAIKILNGEDPNNIPVLTESPNAYMFDYTQLRRFGISVSDLPKGSIVIHEPQSYYYRYKKQVRAVAGLIGGLTLIILLLSINILRRKRAEDKLHKAEAKYRTLVEQMPAITYIAALDRNSTTLYVSPQMETIIGFSPEEYKADPDIWRKQLHPDDRQRVLAEVQRTHQTGEPLSCEYRMLTRDGRVVCFRDEAAVVKNDNGEPMFLQGVMVDVTERRKSEDELKESEERFRAIFDNATDGILLADSETKKFTACNETICQMLGYNLDELKNLGVEDVHTEEHLAYVLEQFERQARGEITLAKDIPVKRKDGSVFYADVNSAPVKLGGKTYLMGLFRDITERRQAEQALQEIRRQQSAILDTIPDIAWLKDEESRYIAANEPFGESCGVKPEDLVGKTDFDLWPETLAKKYRNDDREVMKSRQRKRMVEPLEDSGGKRIWVETIKTPIYNEHGQVVGTSGIARDVTENKRVQEELQKARDQLEIRVKRRTAELAKVAKELRSLTSELSLAEERARRRMASDIHDHVSQKLAISKMKLESLTESVRSSEVATALRETNDLIAQVIKSTRSLTFELSPPVLYELGFEAAVEWLTKQTRQQHGLAAEFTDDGRAKPLDDDIRVVLFQAIRELLVNVAKHAKAQNVEVSTKRVGNKIKVSVEDDGVGFDSSTAPSRRYGSTGFGLFSIHERLGHIGGHLKVESEPGHGTRVSMVAPINHKGKKSKRKTR
ncbi:MAG: PAS domain S-box protein [Planctomycetota bacterium]|nr:MAG: PAS domain S-box protein [Planctomycetota bacterium]